MTNKLLTPEQAAELLQVSKRTMYEWLRNGEIPCERIGDRLIRVRENDVLSPDVRTYFEQGHQLAQNPATVDRAEEFFKKAIALNPKYALAYFALGTMFYQWSHFSRAVEPLKKAIELNPSFPAYMTLGMNYNLWGRYEDAEETLLKALEIEPNSSAVHYEIGCAIMMTAFHDEKRMKEAVEHFRKTLESESAPELSAHFLGQALVLHLRDFQGALKFADELKNRFPNTTEHIKSLVELNKAKNE